MEGAGGVSDKDIDYKNLVLYFSSKSSVSLELRVMLEEYPEVHLQDVKDLGDRPAWLTGVPTIVTLPGLEVYRGTGAVQRARDWVKARARPVAPPLERCSKTWDVAGSWGAAADATGPLKERTLEELIRMRSLADPVAASALEEARE